MIRVKKIAFMFCLLFFAAFVNAHSAQLNKVAAVVNGQVITMIDLQKEAGPELMRAKINPNNPAQAKEVNTILKRVLDTLILDILVEQEAKRLKATVTDSEIDAEITRIMKERKMNKKQLEAQLAQQKLSLDGLRKNLGKSIMRQKVMAQQVGRKVIVTPDEIKKYYDAHKDELFDRSGLHMGLLVYSPKAPAASLAAQIKSGKARFEDVCAKYSIAPNKEKSGDTGPVDWNRLNPTWGEKLTSMKPGEVTDLFDLQGFKAQVYLFRPGGGKETPLTLQQATPQIDAILRQPKAKDRFEDYSAQLRKKAVIDIRL